MIKKWLAKRLYSELRKRTHDQWVLHQFKQCADLMVRKGCSLQHLFELFHEFGHLHHCREFQGTVGLVKVDRFLFHCIDHRLQLVSDASDSSSSILVCFDKDEALLPALQATIYGGMAFSQAVQLLSLIWLPCFVFNAVNSPWWPIHKAGSDKHLLKQMVTTKAAYDFNEAAKLAVKKLGETSDSW